MYAPSQSRLCDSQAGRCSYATTSATNQSSHPKYSFISGPQKKIAAANYIRNVNYLMFFLQIVG
jgi:hypothetical protein